MGRFSAPGISGQGSRQGSSPRSELPGPLPVPQEGLDGITKRLGMARSRGCRRAINEVVLLLLPPNTFGSKQRAVLTRDLRRQLVMGMGGARVILETERLILREWTLEDAPAAFAIYGDPEVMRYIGATGSPDANVEQTRAGLERAIARYPERPGFGFWAAVERTGGAIVGAGLLKHLDGGPEVEVGYHFARRVWGQGYATELARALVAYGFDRLELNRIVGVAYPANRASCRVLEKAGLTYEGRRRYFGQDLEYYIIERSAPASGDVLSDRDEARLSPGQPSVQ